MTQNSLLQLSIALPSMVSTLRMVWTSSRFYNVPSRMVRLLQRVARRHCFALTFRHRSNRCLQEYRVLL